jgi:hypothetical protein
VNWVRKLYQGKGLVMQKGVDEALYGQSDVLCPALGVSPAMRKKFNKKCLDPSLRWSLGARGGSGSAFCPAD